MELKIKRGNVEDYRRIKRIIIRVFYEKFFETTKVKK